MGARKIFSICALAMTAASAVAEPIEPPPGVLARYSASAQDALQSTREGVSHLVEKSFSFLGIKYVRGGNSPETGFDCSGLVRRVFGDAIGLNLPRTAAEMAKIGQKVGKDELKPGDLVFFNTMRRTFSHVGIYIGDNQFLHAPRKGAVVRVENVDVSYWAKRFNGARRIVPEADAGNLQGALTSLPPEQRIDSAR